MPHAEESQLHELISGELPDDDAAQLQAHIVGCDSCANRLREMLLICEGLEAAVASEGHPSDDKILEAADADVNDHLVRCLRCRERREYLTGAVGSPAVTSYDEVYADWMAYEAAKRVMEQLMPEHKHLLQRLWESASEWFRHIRSIPQQDWPALQQSESLAGALGFSGDPGSETLATLVIACTAMRLGDDVVAGLTDPSQLAALAEETARRLGAGPALSARLRETLPHPFTT